MVINLQCSNSRLGESKMKKKSKAGRASEIRNLLNTATPEARWKRHKIWMNANRESIHPNVFGILDDARQLLDENFKDNCNRRLILALLKVLDVFKQFFNMVPYAKKGVKFSSGRDKDSVGKIRKLIRAELKKSPTMKNQELWDVISNKLPKGWKVFKTTSGEYLEGPNYANGVIQYTNYKSFSNSAAKERQLLGA